MDQQSLRKAAEQQLESLQRAGVTQVRNRRKGKLSAPKGEKTAAAAPIDTPLAAASAAAPAAASKPAAKAPAKPAAPAKSPATAAPAMFGASDPFQALPGDSLPIIKSEVAACTQCGEISRTRTQTVFGVGNPQARLCFMGEAPGADEDRQGEPFVGAAGQLLNKIITACTLQREDVYILNVLKCRPPGNREPLPSEAAACRGFLERQLGLIQPEFICCLGAVAARNLLQTDLPIGKLRGRLIDFRGLQVMCTYHPAYLLRNPSAKRVVWEDMQVLMSAMGISLG